MSKRFPASAGMYWQTARLFLITLLLVQVATLAVTGYLVFLPVLRSSVNDLAALMVLSAKTYVELPPGTRPDFVRELKDRQNLTLQVSDGPRTGKASYLPYVLKLEDALGDYLQHDTRIQSDGENPPTYWVDLNFAGEWLRLSFSRQRIGTHPPLTLLLLTLSALVITVVTTILVSRRLTAPLVAMARATRQVSHGALPAPLPEAGPRELATLARSFNRMAIRVRDLLDSRITLLAGISHDLRTPMARIRLQLELMRGKADEQRLNDIEQDLEEMQALISQLLDIAREVSNEKVEMTALKPAVIAVVERFRRSGYAVNAAAVQPCSHPVNALAFKRILTNFLDNAFAHGSPPVEVRLQADETQIRLEVLDQGNALESGDVTHLFEPFVRARRSAGSGLGLAIVRGIAQTYQWQVRLEPNPGGGTTARLVLPVQAGDRAPAAAG